MKIVQAILEVFVVGSFTRDAYDERVYMDVVPSTLPTGLPPVRRHYTTYVMYKLDKARMEEEPLQLIGLWSNPSVNITLR